MKKLILLFLYAYALCGLRDVYAQRSDTTWHYNKDDQRTSFRSITAYTNAKHGRFRAWHRNGLLSGDICFVIKNNSEFLPACSALI